MASDLPTMTPVTSSNLASVGEKDGHLYVTFKGGGTWRYQDAGHRHAALIAADSPGRLFHGAVKGAYGAERVA